KRRRRTRPASVAFALNQKARRFVMEVNSMSPAVSSGNYDNDDIEMEAGMNNRQIEQLAYWLWQQRGMPFGSPDYDWFEAEAILNRREDRFEQPLQALTLSEFGTETRQNNDLPCGHIHDAFYAAQR